MRGEACAKARRATREFPREPGKPKRTPVARPDAERRRFPLRTITF